MNKQALGESEVSAKNKTVFNRIGCLYLPVDDKDAINNWYKKHFNSSGTRDCSLFWETTEEKGLTCNFMTDEWIPGDSYEMFAVRFETDAIEELYERLSAANVKLEPLRNEDDNGLTFVYTDPQGNKFQVWQRTGTVTQPLRDEVPAFMGVAALFFPASDPESTRKWYTEFLGVEGNESGQPMTRTGQQFYFYRSLEPGRTLNFYTGTGEIQHMSIAMISVFGVEEMHRRLIEQGQRVQERILDREGCGFQFQLYDPDGNKLDIWDLQTMVVRNRSRADSPNWKERYKFLNCCFNVDMDVFLAKVVEGAPGTRHKRIQILDYAILRESDPEGLRELVGALEQFGRQYPDWAFEIVYREGPSIYA
ncbi:VOC family protein [Paenibacillus mesophilus]|uniref:VOC family protein n=1 Tax=Paenibacillus mesophilus TaxID=2582849 RepID=UPI00110ED01D|nr:VOC family protein [Paenibacillus mesophilus]TMV46972.1 VOC family protein [Paenibacillus mesophilus]